MRLKLKHKNVNTSRINFKNQYMSSLFIVFPMPGTFQMVPIKMAILNIEGTKTYFFKVIKNISLFQLYISIYRLVFQIIDLLMYVLDCLVKLNLETIK